ncbi:hypothetical protein ACFV9E_36795 [Streptomyces sp. NPDC059835]|uniref:hypothetical protein n=1 Tax=Streptomyces sp. NPDC059835 TaxID=3346967 RepID=UPI003647F03B
MLLAATDTAAEARAEVLGLWNSTRTQFDDLASYSIGPLKGMEFAKKLLRDLKSLVTELKDPNSMKVILGSFKITGRVTAASDEGIQVTFTVREDVNFSSFMHLFTGYGTTAEKVAETYDKGGMGYGTMTEKK